MSDLKLNRIYAVHNGWAVEYQQHYNEVLVYLTYVGLFISSDGTILSLGSDFHPNISITTTPKLTKEEAIGVAREELDRYLLDRYSINCSQIQEGYTGEPSGDLMIFPKEDGGSLGYHLVWKISMCKSVAFVDAINREVIRRYLDIEFENTL
jgi:Zn-dependent metalloprotease